MWRVRFPHRSARARCIAVVVALLVGSSVVAQMRARYGEGRFARPIREGLPEQAGGFVFCRLQYDSGRSFPSGYGWSTDYPRSDHNFLIRLEQITYARAARWDDGELGWAVVRPTDSDLFRCPFLFASDVGTAEFSEADVTGLREYFLKGGFLWVDDFWGERAWREWVNQIGRVLPEYAIHELPPEHSLYTSYYRLLEVPQIPSIQSWYDTGGSRQERGFEPGEPRLRAITNDTGRIMVLMSHNTDIADGWERETDNEDFFYAFTAEAYGVGINVALWIMSH